MRIISPFIFILIIKIKCLKVFILSNSRRSKTWHEFAVNILVDETEKRLSEWTNTKFEVMVHDSADEYFRRNGQSSSGLIRSDCKNLPVNHELADKKINADWWENYWSSPEFKPIARNWTDLCLRIRKDSNLDHIPIMMISAHPNAKELCLKAGANDFILKRWASRQDSWIHSFPSFLSLFCLFNVFQVLIKGEKPS